MPHINAAGLALIVQFEGEALRAYPDPGTGGAPWTIGIGHTASVHPGQVITDAQALAFLRIDVADAERAIVTNTHVTLTPNEFSALVAWEYNTGAYAGSPVRQYINGHNFAAALEHLERYVYAGGAIMAGLVRRRAAERALFERA